MAFRTDRELRAAVARASAGHGAHALVSSIIALIVASPLNIAIIWLWARRDSRGVRGAWLGRRSLDGCCTSESSMAAAASSRRPNTDGRIDE